MSVAASRRCAVASVGVFALSLAVATGTARGQGISDWPAPIAPGAAPAQANTQQATTGQAATTSADATDAQPTNIFISLRVDSPGDNGPVSQTDTTAVAGNAANDAATAQDAWQHSDSGAQPAQGQPQASAQDSGTSQAAAARATATRPKPTNVVVSVRVNSPGYDAPVTQSSTVAVGAASKNAAATAQTAHQTQVAASPAAPAPPTAAPPEPARGAVAERPAVPQSSALPDASAPPACVRVAPGPAGTAATRIAITIGEPCHEDAGKRAAVPRFHTSIPATRRQTHETPVHAAPPVPAAPVVQEVAAVSPAPAASSPPRATPPRPAPATRRPHAAASKSLDPLAASTRAGELVAAAALPSAGGAQYEVMLALLLAMLGAAAVWSYGGARRYRFRRWR